MSMSSKPARVASGSFSALVASVLVVAAGCSSTEEGANADAKSSAAMSKRHVYVAKAAGGIEWLALEDETSYMLKKKDCTADCISYGTYSLDRGVLTLNDEVTHEQRTINVGATSASAPKSLRPLAGEDEDQGGSSGSLVVGPAVSLVPGVTLDGQPTEAVPLSVNARDAEVVIDGNREPNLGFNCTNAVEGITPEEVAECSMANIRDSLKAHIRSLINQAAADGIVMEAVAGGREDGVPVRLTRILVSGTVESASTRLGAEFLIGAPPENANEPPPPPAANASVQLRAATVATKFQFEFDLDGSRSRPDGSVRLLTFDAPQGMERIYRFKPFHYMRGDFGVHLNLGAVMARFAGNLPILSTLLSMMGGGFAINIEAQREERVLGAACLDSSVRPGATATSSAKTLFDRDFIRNVLYPVCTRYKQLNPSVPTECAASPDELGPDAVARAAASLRERRVVPATGCTQVGNGTIRLDFEAPKAWGVAALSEVTLYDRTSDPRTWQRRGDARVNAVDTRGCGANDCVHIVARSGFFGNLTCATSQNVGLSQASDERYQVE